jgi:ATP-dependent DNA helicase RecQ
MGDELRERLLAGYRYILVDEYQDIDQRQYDLISALAGRQTQDRDARLTLLAVGDDDQNIYSFRRHQQRFHPALPEDYQARLEYLVENYRSSRHIIAAANRLIAANPGAPEDRHPIRINHARQNDAAGGRWQRSTRWRRAACRFFGPPTMRSARPRSRWPSLPSESAGDPSADWSDFAILARNRATLDPSAPGATGKMCAIA